MKVNRERLQQLNNELHELIDEYANDLHLCELVNCLIRNATTLALCCAPNELVGIKTILACVEVGINEYEETHS